MTRTDAATENPNPLERLPDEQMQLLRVAARPLWDALEALGWTDSYGGAEFQRVFPEAIAFIHRQANELVIR